MARLLPYLILVITVKLIRMTQSIRHQQSEKRNLAEQAFDLTRKNHDLLGVSNHPLQLSRRIIQLTRSNSGWKKSYPTLLHSARFTAHAFAVLGLLLVNSVQHAAKLRKAYTHTNKAISF